MTGEITLSGDVLPIGGLNEKMLAAKRHGITDIIIPARNQKDVVELQPELLEGLKIHYVKQISDVLKLALENSPYVKRTRTRVKGRTSAEIH